MLLHQAAGIWKGKIKIGSINYVRTLRREWDERMKRQQKRRFSNCKTATKEQLRQFLLSSENTIPIDEAIRRA